MLLTVPEDREANALQVIACTQLVNLIWRVSIEVEDVEIFFEEGRRLAEKLGDRRALVNLAVVYSFIPYGAGDVASYAELARENREAAHGLGDLALEANATSPLVDALFLTARFPEGLIVAEDGLSRFPARSPAADWLVGLNPYTYCAPSCVGLRAYGWAAWRKGTNNADEP